LGGEAFAMRVLVTGGGGFLGSRICELLAERGDRPVAFGRSDYTHLLRRGIQTVRGDLRNSQAVREACRGCDAVIHAGALPGIWRERGIFHDINVVGTRNVLAACGDCGVPKLVYTSSPSVVFGDEALCGVDESQPYPARYLADYPATKAEAERRVLAANGQELSTVALRPHLIWGPGDPHLFPRIIAKARAGTLRQIGDGTNLVDVTYIDNAASAHILALDRLAPGAPCAGKAYFISQGEPIRLWPWLNEILLSLGIPPFTKRVSYRLAYAAGTILEYVYRLFGLASEPPMTRFLAGQLAKSHYFDISASRRDLGYEAKVTTADGTRRLTDWLCAAGFGGRCAHPNDG